jgi:hypothetical protein
MRTTSAPRSQATSATRYPILPLERLVTTRTGSIDSRVGPAVTTIRRPASFPPPRSTRAAWARMVSGSLIRPGRSEGPSASAPISGPTIATPRARSRSRLAWVSGRAYISSFIAGATRTGAVRARSSEVRTSSARPCAMRATRCAVAGATMMRWASCGRRTWASARPGSHREVRTGRPVSASNVAGPTNSAALRVSTTSTEAPASVRRRASWQLL